MTNPNPTDVRTPALLYELQEQRSFLGDRAANLAAELAESNQALELANARIRSLEKELHKCKNPELPSAT